MKKGNFIAAALFAAFAIYVIYEASFFPASKARVPGPAVYPTGVAILMLMAAVSLVITTLRMTPEEDKKIDMLTPDAVRVYVSMAVLSVYAFLVPIVGFCTVSAVMLFGLIKWFGGYRFHYCAFVSVLVTGIIYLVFSEVLNVPFRFGVLL